LVFIDAWRAQFRAGRQCPFDDEDENDVVLNFVLELRFVEPERTLIPSIRGGSRPGKSPNIERFEIEMHHRMISDYFCDEPVYGPNYSVDAIACNVHFFLWSWRRFLSETINLSRK
jgi:hypothetical protein